MAAVATHFAQRRGLAFVARRQEHPMSRRISPFSASNKSGAAAKRAANACCSRSNAFCLSSSTSPLSVPREATSGRPSTPLQITRRSIRSSTVNSAVFVAICVPPCCWPLSCRSRRVRRPWFTSPETARAARACVCWIRFIAASSPPVFVSRPEGPRRVPAQCCSDQPAMPALLRPRPDRARTAVQHSNRSGNLPPVSRCTCGGMSVQVARRHNSGVYLVDIGLRESRDGSEDHPIFSLGRRRRCLRRGNPSGAQGPHLQAPPRQEPWLCRGGHCEAGAAQPGVRLPVFARGPAGDRRKTEGDAFAARCGYPGLGCCACKENGERPKEVIWIARSCCDDRGAGGRRIAEGRTQGPSVSGAACAPISTRRSVVARACSAV